MKYYTMIDIGASSGRIMLAEIDNKQLALQEVHRFKNGFSRIDGSDRWDIETIFEEILTGLSKLKALGVTECHLGIDTWAVDYCLIGTDGQLLQLPISYRDERTKDTMEKVAQEIDKETIYAKTGIQFLNFNTLYQLYEEDKALLAKTDKILMIPDYLAYRLTGEMVGEVTNVSSSQMLNLETGEFDKDLLELVGIPREKFPELVVPGTKIGDVKADLTESYDLPKIEVIAAATHDTASANVGVPALGGKWAYLSSGTWSLIGVENDAPINDRPAYEANFTNEWGAYDTYRFLKNITGMWFVQEIARNLDYRHSYGEMAQMAYAVEPFLQYVDLNDPRFLNPANMIAEIQSYCRERGEIVPETTGELVMCVYSNLALAYAHELKKVEALTKETIDVLHIVGGGANVKLLNQLTADVTGKLVVAGPTEGTAIGNLLVQMIATGEFADLAEARKWLRSQIHVEEYPPNPIADREHLKKYEEKIGV